jgi:hypothetical protein
MLRLPAILALLATALFAARAAGQAGEPAGDEPALADAAALVEQLDADRFEIRQQAADRLRALLDNAQGGERLAEALRTWLADRVADGSVSLEARSRLDRLLGDEWSDDATMLAEPSTADVATAVEQLAAATYDARWAARRRIERWSAAPQTACELLVLLKAHLADPRLAAADRTAIEGAYRRVRAAWLVSDPEHWTLTPVDAAQIDRWIAALVAPAAGRVEQFAARRELLDVLCRDDLLPLTIARLSAGRQAEADEAAAARLDELLELTRPAMVAEFWDQGRHEGVQHLYVDAPTLPEMGMRPSHFDRIDDRTARCVSGNNLPPGDYPVGVFFRHPQRDTAQFHLVNLPTPRRRQQYECLLELPDAVRWAEISTRTLDRCLIQQRALVADELRMLQWLEPGAVSRFAGPYFRGVDDRAYPQDGYFGQLGRASHHGVLCAILAEMGTREAVPGILEAVVDARFLPPNVNAPYDLPHLAALSIAARDPWSQVDAWLLDLAALPDALVHAEAAPEPPPTLGATAAALLAARHGAAPADLGLVPAGQLQEWFAVEGFRYADGAGPDAVERWWRETANARLQP